MEERVTPRKEEGGDLIGKGKATDCGESRRGLSGRGDQKEKKKSNHPEFKKK